MSSDNANTPICIAFNSFRYKPSLVTRERTLDSEGASWLM